MSPQPIDDQPFPPWGKRIVLLARVTVLSLCALIVAVSGSGTALLLPLLALVGLAAVMSLPLRPAWSAPAPIVEGALAAAIVASVATLPDPLLPYLVVPPLAAGLLRGVRVSVLTSLAITLTLVGWRVATGGLGTTDTRIAIVQWVGVGLAVGLVGAWGRWSTLRAIGSEDRYAEANRLLTQLRDVARSLPAGFDEIGIASGLLSALKTDASIDQGIVCGLTEEGHLAPVTSIGADRAMWGAGIPHGPWAEALTTASVVLLPRRLDESPGYGALLPLRLGGRPVGVVGIARVTGAFESDELASAERHVDDTALRLDTGRLFSDVRTWATVEERRRMSREIHDGIAQELTGLGFIVDDLASRTSDPGTRDELTTVRQQISDMITELRLSIFDLRTHVDPGTGLGGALGSYVRQVGTMAGLTVHLVLDEDIRRLSVETETELLRIAQEAIANARRHANARNLWVTLRVSPPHALLEVADDGRGMGSAGSVRRDSYGLEIMRERAERIGADLRIQARPGGGTTVVVRLGEGVRDRSCPHPAHPDTDQLPERGTA